MQTNTIDLALRLLMSAVLLFACSLGPASTDASSRDVVDKFFGLPLKEQIAAFPNYEFDDQYAIYIYGNQRRHPPAIYLAKPFAQKGAIIVEKLTHQIFVANDDLTTRDIIMVFSEMNRLKVYAVSGDTKLMGILESAVSKMGDPGWKATTENELATMKNWK